jgi:hypothetical protein
MRYRQKKNIHCHHSHVNPAPFVVEAVVSGEWAAECKPVEREERFF